MRKLLDSIGIDYPTDFENYTFEEYMDELYEIIGDECIITYSRAMKFLAENDPGLTESLRIAHSLGYSAKSLNSELLATILLQEMMRDELDDMYDELRHGFNTRKMLAGYVYSEDDIESIELDKYNRPYIQDEKGSWYLSRRSKQ